MKSFLMAAALVLVSTSVQAKVLTVDCQNDRGESVELVSEIANVNTPQVLQSLAIDGVEQDLKRDVSQMPIYSKGTISLSMQYGRFYYNSVNLSVTDCEDDFSATGQAQLSKYVGGFAGTSQSSLTCSCSFK